MPLLMRGSVLGRASLKPMSVLTQRLLSTSSSTPKRSPFSKRNIFILGLTSSALGYSLLRNTANPEQSMVTAPAGVDVILYQYDPCPFCNKVRAYMDFHNIAYKVVEVNPMGKKEMSFTDYKKVPLALINGVEIRDSVKIIDYLQALRVTKGEASVQRTESTEQWREWMGSTLEKLVSPNLYRTPTEALRAFDYITAVSNFTTFEGLSAKYIGAFVMYLIGKRNKKRLGIDNERQAMYDALDKWVEEGVADKAFEGGDAPAMIDLEVFGICKALSNMPLFDDIMAHSKISTWYSRMVEQVGSDKRIVETPVVTAA
eukprot:CFRG0274T1